MHRSRRSNNGISALGLRSRLSAAIVLLLAATTGFAFLASSHSWSPLVDTDTLEIREVVAAGRAERLGSYHDLDEPIMWVNRKSPEDSLIIATDKANERVDLAGLHVFSLSGERVQSISGVYTNNIDLREQFPLNGEPSTLVTVSNRAPENYRLLFYTLSPDADPASGDVLTDVSGSNLSLDFEPYGQALYRDRETDRWYVFVSRYKAPYDIYQYEIVPGSGDDAGKVVLRDPDPVRVISYRPSEDGTESTPLSLTEGLSVDDRKKNLYVGEEDFGLLRYSADPNDGTRGHVIERVASDGGRLLPDVEGVAVVPTLKRKGYVVVVGQNGDGLSRYEVYDRKTNRYLHSFVINHNQLNPELSAGMGTDGIFAHFGYLSEEYPNGVFIAHTSSEEGISLLLVRFDDVWPEPGLATITALRENGRANIDG